MGDLVLFPVDGASGPGLGAGPGVLGRLALYPYLVVAGHLVVTVAEHQAEAVGLVLVQFRRDKAQVGALGLEVQGTASRSSGKSTAGHWDRWTQRR